MAWGNSFCGREDHQDYMEHDLDVADRAGSVRMIEEALEVEAEVRTHKRTLEIDQHYIPPIKHPRGEKYTPRKRLVHGKPSATEEEEYDPTVYFDEGELMKIFDVEMEYLAERAQEEEAERNYNRADAESHVDMEIERREGEAEENSNCSAYWEMVHYCPSPTATGQEREEVAGWEWQMGIAESQKHDDENETYFRAPELYEREMEVLAEHVWVQVMIEDRMHYEQVSQWRSRISNAG